MLDSEGGTCEEEEIVGDMSEADTVFRGSGYSISRPCFVPVIC